MKKIVITCILASFTTALPAQIDETDPKKKMQEILDTVAEEMQQIDKWLQESSRNQAAAKAMKQNVERMNKLLDSVGKSQKQVVKNIDDLLQEAEKLKKKGQGQQQQQQQQKQQQQKDGKQQRSQQKRDPQKRRLDRPELGQKNQPQNPQQKGKRDQNGKERREKGKNELSGDPRKGGTERINGKRIQGAWGDLPDYLLKHGRGSMPGVPEKYRKYLEAITKQGHKKSRKK